MQPLMSIVIANYNYGLYLEAAVQSVLSQCDAEMKLPCGSLVELIIVDGGSTDNSLDVIKKYAGRVAWWCSEKDAGQGEALNKGFKRASGEYYLWLNADDVLLPGALESVAKAVEESGSRWIVGNTKIIDEGNRVLKCLRDGAWRDAMYRHAPVRVYGPAAVFHHSLFERAGGFDETLHYTMDTDLWLKFKNMGERYLRVNRYLWGFRCHSLSKTNSGGLAVTESVQDAERRRIYQANGLVVKWWNPMMNRAWRLLNGAYFRAAVDSVRFRGRKAF